ncbi:UNVERIFIED_CONTAM: hypothetical protein K2H54_013416 [Gekko kuhli]
MATKHTAFTEVHFPGRWGRRLLNVCQSVAPRETLEGQLGTEQASRGYSGGSRALHRLFTFLYPPLPLRSPEGLPTSVRIVFLLYIPSFLLHGSLLKTKKEKKTKLNCGYKININK